MRLEKLTAALTAVLLLATACSQDVEGTLYNPSKGDADGFAFAASVLNVETGIQDDGRVLVPIYRSGAATGMAQVGFEIQVDVTVTDTVIGGIEKTHVEQQWVDTDPAGIFSLTTPRVVFADGATTAYAQIRYTDISALGLTEKYKIRLTIKDGLSPSKRGQTTVSISRKLTFDYLGKCRYFDIFLFENTYEADIYRAREAEVYRVMDPYSEGFLTEDFDAGWAGVPAMYVQFLCDENGMITYEPFCVGLMFQAKYPVYAYWPGQYKWGKDFSEYNSQNRKISDKEFQLYPVYCAPDFQYGYLNDGAYPVTITLP